MYRSRSGHRRRDVAGTTKLSPPLSFLLYLAYGHLPALFALPAGLGDIAAGIAAPLVARKLTKGTGRTAVVWFNVFGIVDLAAGMTLGELTSAPVLHVTPTSAAITDLPLALIPTFTVPLMLALHITSLVLLRKNSPAPSTSELVDSTAMTHLSAGQSEASPAL